MTIPAIGPTLPPGRYNCHQRYVYKTQKSAESKPPSPPSGWGLKRLLSTPLSKTAIVKGYDGEVIRLLVKIDAGSVVFPVGYTCPLSTCGVGFLP